MISDKKLIEMIDNHVKVFKEINDTVDSINTIFGMIPESKLSELLFNMFTDTTGIISELAGDGYEWLEWFIWENDCGEKKLECTVDGIKYNVNTVRKLVATIKKCREK